MTRLVIITEIIAPYRIPLFNDLAKTPNVDLHVIFLAETDPALRQWQVYTDEIRFSYEVLRSARRRIGRYNALLNFGVGNALAKARADVILCGGYNYIASWQAQHWARSHGTPFFLWSESNTQDMRRYHALVEMLKGKFLRRCTGFVVPGRSASEFLQTHDVSSERIFTAVNAVDNDLFAGVASAARQNASQLRKELGLPLRYFLYAGRLVREKGIFELLAAYATLDEQTRDQIGVVFVGDGASKTELEAQASSVSRGMVKFIGFAHRERLAEYYALADALVLPTYSDTWGLVVNEAMACGLPVIVSRAAGCAADLIVEGWNGCVVPAGEIAPLASAMRELASRPELCASMGANSAIRIAEYSPQRWCEGIVGMVEAVGPKHG